jgi:hypothetical protein
MKVKRLTMMMSLALGLAAASGTSAQVMMESAVISNGGGHVTGSTMMLDYTIGQPVVGRASNGTMTGDFGFWTPSVVSGPSSVDFEFSTGAVSAARVAPNPARDRAKLDLVLAQRGQVDVVLYDANGRAVATLYSGERSAGAFEVPMDLTGIASGTYYVAISVPGALVQRPLTVVR